MAEYVNKEMFLSQMGLVGDETKYGNRDAEHSNRSYSTWMGYEIMDSIDDCVEEDVVKVVRCKDCIHFDHQKALRPGGIWCEYWGTDPDPEDWCCKGERKDHDS